MVFLSSVFLITRFQNILPDVDYINGDAGGRYYPLAVNLAAGNGFSLQMQPPFEPDDFNQPAYPFFVALIYRLTGGSNTAVSVIQCLLEILIIIITLRLAYSLKLAKNTIVLTAFFAVISPFLAIFSNRLLTEIPATFALLLLCYLLIVGVENKSLKIWIFAGIIGGLCLLIRPDALISVFLMFVAACCAILVSRFKSQAVPRILLFIAVVSLTMIPWTLRNYKLTGEILPLGRVNEQTNLSYVKWLNTWLVEPLDMPSFWWGRMELKIPLNSAENAFPAEEKNRAENSLKIAQYQNSFEGASSDEFARLAEDAHTRRPLTSYFIVPSERAVMTLARLPNYVEDESNQTLAYSLWLPLVAISLMGILVMSARKIFLIPAALFVGRMFLPFYTAIGAEPRFLIETLPILYISTAVGIFWLFRRVRKLRQSNDMLNRAN